MQQKLKQWLINNKKDIRIFLILFVIGFFLSIINVTDIDNPLWSGFAFSFSGVIIINAYRYSKKWLKAFKRFAGLG